MNVMMTTGSFSPDFRLEKAWHAGYCCRNHLKFWHTSIPALQQTSCSSSATDSIHAIVRMARMPPRKNVRQPGRTVAGTLCQEDELLVDLEIHLQNLKRCIIAPLALPKSAVQEEQCPAPLPMSPPSTSTRRPKSPTRKVYPQPIRQSLEADISRFEGTLATSTTSTRPLPRPAPTGQPQAEMLSLLRALHTLQRYDVQLVPELELQLQQHLFRLDLRQHASMLSYFQGLGHTVSPEMCTLLISSSASAMAAVSLDSATRPRMTDSPSEASSSRSPPAAGMSATEKTSALGIKPAHATARDGKLTKGSIQDGNSSNNGGQDTESTCRLALKVACGLSYQLSAHQPLGHLGSSLSSCWEAAFDAATFQGLARVSRSHLSHAAAALADMQAHLSPAWLRSLGHRAAELLCIIDPQPFETQGRLVPAPEVLLGAEPKGAGAILGAGALAVQAWCGASDLPGGPAARRPKRKRPLAGRGGDREALQALKMLSVAVQLASAAARLGSRLDPESMAGCTAPGARACQAALNGLPPPLLADLAWALARLGARPGREWGHALLESSHVGIACMQPAQLVRCLHAMVLLGIKPYDLWLRDMELRMLYAAPVGSSRAEDVVLQLWCLARMKRVPDFHTCTWLVRELTRLMPAMTMQQVKIVLSSLDSLFPKMRDKSMRALANEMARRLASGLFAPDSCCSSND